MKKTPIIVLFMIILSIFINCFAIRDCLSNYRSKRSNYYLGYVYDIDERKPIQGIRVYPNCPQVSCTEVDRIGAITDENGYFKFTEPENRGFQLLVIESEGKVIDSIRPLLGGPAHRRIPLFLDKKRADTIFIDMRYKSAVSGKPDHRRLAW
jgi:hypothetical protein